MLATPDTLIDDEDLMMCLADISRRLLAAVAVKNFRSTVVGVVDDVEVIVLAASGELNRVASVGLINEV